MIDLHSASYKSHKMDVLKASGVYFVTSTELSDVPTLDLLDIFLKAGGKLFQLREKTFSKKKLFETGLLARKLADKYDAVFIVNDDIDVALTVGADGVHLGQDDMPVAMARKLLGENFILGVSTHNIEEAVMAQKQGADYINIGPVFPTQTKPHVSALDAKGIETILPHVHIPFTFMGGIKEDNMAVLLKYKPSALAMVTEITKSVDVDNKVKRLLSIVIDISPFLS
ncbi:MAG: thiamine phosphate synthase [Proteobacteria bacterium]|nr:thiamine phosphate synthase [Pseudomonadota bacterium]